MVEWHSVSPPRPGEKIDTTGLPPQGKSVLLACKPNSRGIPPITVGYRFQEHRWFTVAGYTGKTTATVTHWAELPEGPRE